MALILIDGMEDASSWTAPGVTFPAGRNANAMTVTFTQTADFTIPTAQESATLTIGFAHRTPTLPSSAHIFVRFRSDANATNHTELALNADGSLSVLRNGTLLGTASAAGVIAANTWHYIEFQAVLHDTAGAYAVRVNGTTVISGTSADTKNAGTKTVYDTVRLICNNNISGGINFDDLYLRNDATFLGDISVETLYPNGNGNVNQWVGSDADSVNNYLLVDEVPASSTDYTGSPTAGQQDLYTLTDLVRTTGTIVAVCHAAYAAKNDAGAKQLKLVNRRSADNKSGALDLATTYINKHYVLETDPETGSAWTFANVNALQSGVEVV